MLFRQYESIIFGINEVLCHIISHFYFVSRRIPHIEGVGTGNQETYYEDILFIKKLPFPVFRSCRKSTPYCTSLPERRNGNIQYFSSSNGNRTHNLSHLQPYAYTPAPRLDKNKYRIYNNSIRFNLKIFPFDFAILLNQAKLLA